MMSALLTKEQKLLLLFQRKQVIEELPTDFIESSEGEVDDLAKSFHAQLSSTKPFDRIFALGKISSILKSYEENNLNNMDKKLVKGFYNRNLNDYKYLRR